MQMLQILQRASQLTEFLPDFPGLWPADRTELKLTTCRSANRRILPRVRQEHVLTDPNPPQIKRKPTEGADAE